MVKPMVDALLTAQHAAQQAMQALRRKDRREARRLAEQAVHLDPRLEEGWLVLAAVASPEASLFYLRKALEVNPGSAKARKGMHWAAQRLRKAKARSSGLSVQRWEQAGLALPLPALGDTQPVSLRLGQTRPIRIWRSAARSRPVLIWAAAGLFVLMVLAITLAFGNSWVVMARSGVSERPVAALFKPSLTPTNTPTNTPTSTPTPTPTNTPTPTPTDTPTPTPTDTPVPTDTPIPPTEAPPEEPEAREPPISADGRWIEVDLSDQMVYAYDGDTLVNSFLASTGTWMHPTVTGSFQIYVKYRYTDMSGPGYYLPDVPYTMYFYKGFGLHGTYWHNNFGTPMSHGCVNLQTDNAGWLFDWASVGTLVNVHE
jgi:lipoprotein-anchoring transpeptidase ErfK/SrfK